jgi:Arc/MetJ-type ribon-helix-helix transcriptional regulator
LKIVTVNIPESYIDAIEPLVGSEGGLYPSRSELVRVAVREFLIREMRIAINVSKDKEIDDNTEDNSWYNDFVKVPVERKDEKGEPMREFKTYKIIRCFEDVFPQENDKTDNADLKSECERQLTKKPQKKRERLGNPFWKDAWDEHGNLVRVPKKELEILNPK